MVQRSILVRFNNNATSCFDRILVHALTLCLQSYGMPKKLTTILGKILEDATYAVKIGIGISEETYQHSEASPAFGSGQGSGALAQGWGKIASNAFDAHDKFSHGCKYKDPWKICVVILGMLGYVDNNNITSNGKDGEDVQDIIKRTEHDAQLWNDLLRATGGALNLDKFLTQVLDYTFAINGGPVIAPANPDVSIVIQDRLFKQDVVQRQQHKKLMKKQSSHVRRLVCLAMSPRCAWVNYTAVFLSSIGYPLSMCHMSPPQLHNLQKKYIPVLLNKIGIIRTHPNSLVFGTRAYGGVGCSDLWIEQGLAAIETLYSNSELQDTGGISQ
jgi:hypothetical protein